MVQEHLFFDLPDLQCGYGNVVLGSGYVPI